MNKTPFALIAMTAVAALGGYAVCNRPFQTATLNGRIAAGDVPRVLDPQVQAVIDELSAKWDRVEKFSTLIHTQIPNAAGMPGKTTGTGDYAYQKTDGDPLIRLNLRNMLTIDKETTLEDGRKSNRLFSGEVLLTTHDGDAMWQMIAQYKNKELYKRRYDSAEVLQLGGRALWDTLTDGTTVKALPDQKVEEVQGIDAYVFSVIPLDGDWSSIHWFDKQTGLRIKIVEKDAKGTETLTLWLDQIDYNPQFAQDRFVFEIPEGWEVIDETGEQTAPKQKNTSQEQTTPKEKNSSKEQTP